MTEELALNQALGDGATVDGHEGIAQTGREGVDETGHHLFARATFAQQQHGCVGGGHLTDDLDHAAQGSRIADQDRLGLGQVVVARG